ncbi:MAG: D-alanine--poly(phosphoribitol) ligase subunit DltC [Clostridia bacterium]|nr:D-alanine--poly(phosphoribitol) ligase subunit DltC [Clostridia bacterium]
MDFENLALEIMEEICETDEIKEDLDLDLFDAGLIDSLSTINIILLLEEKLGVRLQPTDFERNDITTVNNFIKFLEKRCSNA